MSGVHIKGYILQLLLEKGPLWDHEVVDAVATAYGVTGPYWTGTVRLTLTDLYAGGLLTELAATVDPEKSQGETKILFQYAVNDFGRTRMEQAGLLGATT